MISISIIIPVYKVELYVRKCIQSILEQEECGASIECIIVDDCSPDNSMSIIHSLIDNYKGQITFRFLRHEQNKGLSAARNTGLDNAHGDFILFIDSDDWLPSNSISKFANILQRNPDIDMIIGNYFSSKESSISQNIINKETVLDNFQVRKLLLNYQIVTCFAWNKVIKTNIAKSNKFQEGIIYEDILWAFFLFYDIKSTLIIPDVTYIYENGHPNSIVNTANNKDNTITHMRSVCYMGNAILDSPYEDLFADSVIYFFRKFIVAFRLQYEHHLENEDCRIIRQLRKRLILTSFKKGRLFLALYIFILTYPPTSYMFNFGWIRRHYYTIEKTGRMIANCFERIHRNPQHTNHRNNKE